MASELVEVRLRWNGNHIDKFTSQVDPENPDDLQGLIEDAVKRDRKHDQRHISEYQIEVRRKRNGARLVTYVGRSR